jgi:hypothetical protein
VTEPRHLPRDRDLYSGATGKHHDVTGSRQAASQRAPASPPPAAAKGYRPPRGRK